VAGVHLLPVRAQAWQPSLPGAVVKRHGGRAGGVHQDSSTQVCLSEQQHVDMMWLAVVKRHGGGTGGVHKDSCTQVRVGGQECLCQASCCQPAVQACGNAALCLCMADYRMQGRLDALFGCGWLRAQAN
jgi:hypothetical protein